MFIGYGTRVVISIMWIATQQKTFPLYELRQQNGIRGRVIE